MEKIILILMLYILYPLIISISQIPYEIEEIKAPFIMNQLQRPSFPNRNISIIKTGAKQNKLCTISIQKAIDHLAKLGGGTVIIPQGIWLSGRIELKSNINLRLE